MRSARARFGVALCIAGGLMLSFAGGQYALGAVRADHARSEWDAERAAIAVAHARTLGVDPASATALVEGAPVAHLVIPKIGLDEIVLEGVDGTDLNAGPGHLPGSALPGQPGNAIISAHRDRHFNHFDQLALGDTVVTESGDMRTTWVITAKRVIEKTSPALFRTRDATLTLTTCWPIRYFGPAPERLILTAKRAR